MDLTLIQRRLRERVRQAANEKYGVTLETIAGETPPRGELGDYAFPVAFELARQIKQQTGEKRNPRLIAEEIAGELRRVPNVAQVEVAGAGYINVFFNRAALLGKTFVETENDAIDDASDKARGEAHKIIVEHTNINPNKAAHIGHLRNAVLGDAFVRILRANGEQVEVQSYIDNTGVQVADVVIGFQHINKMLLEDVKRLDETLAQNNQSFDYYCWDLYSQVNLFYRGGTIDGAEDKERLRLRADALREIESGAGATAELAEYISTRVVRCHLNTMRRIGITYDVLPRESEILHLHFWDAAFEQLKEAGAIRFEIEGKNANCWVMPMDAHASTDEHEADKILVRSNATVTYAGKDIAYQLWKLGEIDKDFYYTPFVENDGEKVYVTTSDASQDDESAPRFGNGSLVFNVIDSRQSYTQDVVKRGVAAVVPKKISDNESNDTMREDAHVQTKERSVHLGYEMVALSPAACEELGLSLSEEDKKRAFIEMSGRKGLGVKADDLIDRLLERASVETAARNPDFTDNQKEKVGAMIAVGALRYFLLKWTRNTIIAFDFKEALALEGETGVYCQYSAARANTLFRKVVDAAMLENATTVLTNDDELIRAQINNHLTGDNGEELWALWSLAARMPEALNQSIAQLEPAHLAKYAFQLARSFSAFYQRKTNRITEEQDAVRRAVLIAVAHAARTRLVRALDILGINVPERM